MTVHTPHVSAANANDGVLHRGTRDVFGRLDRFLNRSNSLIELDDHALARAARFGEPMSAIAQAGVRHLGHQRACLGAADINCREKTSLLVPHVYKFRNQTIFLIKNQFDAVPGNGFATTALGFGLAAFAATAGDECADFFMSVLCAAGCAADGFALGSVACFATSFFGGTDFATLVAGRFAFGFMDGFFAATFGSSLLSVSSNAGLGMVLSCGLIFVISAAGLTPAAIAAFAAASVRAGCFGFPSMSGLTMT